MSTRLKKKSTAIAVLFFLEMKCADAHEASCEATHEAGLCPMKRAFGSRRSYRALRFMRAKIAEQFASSSQSNAPLHIDEVDASLTKQWVYAILYLKDGNIIANDKLSEQSMDFAVQIINLVKQLKEQRESIISNQIGRSGTSIGANIREAKYAHGTGCFVLWRPPPTRRIAFSCTMRKETGSVTRPEGWGVCSPDAGRGYFRARRK